MMKQLSYNSLLVILMSMLVTTATAADISVKNADGVSIHYNYINDGKELEVTYWYGVYYQGDIVIPEEVTYMNRTRKVTSIGYNAFHECRKLKSVTIPSSIISMKVGAFYECHQLLSVYISDLEAWCKIDFEDYSSNPLYYAPHLYLNGVEIKDLFIPNNVTKIKDYSFTGWSNLNSVTISDNVTSIGDGGFKDCIRLTTVTIPNSVTLIGNFAFQGCNKLDAIDIPNSVTAIGYQAFYECRDLSSLTIGNSVTTIGWGAFYRCYKLTSLNIPSSIISIESKAFAGCSSLISINVESGNAVYDSRNNCNAIIETKYNRLIVGCQNTIIPNSITSIGSYAFANITRLTSITIPNSVTRIGEDAFYGCKLTSLTIPNSVVYIDQGAFAGMDIPTIISLIEKPFSIRGKTASNGIYGAFSNNTFNNATLYVPVGTIDKYKSTEGWKDFVFFEEGTKLYKLTYIIDGEEFKTIELYNGVIITPEPDPVKEGYTFSGWSEIPETMPDHDVTVTGSFTINKYKLTYFVDGEEYKTYDVEYNSTITAETAPTKEGYTFSGWSEIPETMPANDVTITGTFTINKYKLIYMVDGVEYKSFDIEYNSAITPEADPTKDGYKFSGWSEIPETMPAHDVTITGSFERVYSGGDVANLIDLLLFGNVDDEDIALYDMNGDGELNIGDLILIMRAAQNNSRNRSAANRAAENQTIEFAADIVTMKPGETSALNISLSSSISGIYGIQFEVNLPEGFSLEKGSNDKIYEMSANQVDDITCNDRDLGNGTYRFFIYSSTLQELKGGSLMSLNLKADADKALGNYAVTISNVALSDYDGHVTKEDGSSVGVKVTNTFTLLYQVDGEDYKSYEIEYGESITPEAEPAKEGYTFSGWSEIPETMPAEDVIVKGTFTVNQYILTYVVDGEVYKEYSYDYGSAITPEAEPTKEGYTFSGWSEIPETMPAKEVYVVGSFTINKYKITYVIDGEVYLTEEVEYGSRITPPTPSDHEGYDFAWDDYPDTMPAHDITINGAYTPTGIEAVLASEPDVKIFTVSGKPLNKVQKGVNILRYKDGRTRKIVVK